MLIVYCTSAVLALVALVLACGLVMQLCARTRGKLFPATVGPNVYHPEVHTMVRRQWTDRIADELELSHYNTHHNPGVSNLFLDLKPEL